MMSPTSDSDDAPIPALNAARLIRSLLAGATAALLGYLVFMALRRQGYYAVALPGMLFGFVVGLTSGVRSFRLAIICGAVALAAGLAIEWNHGPRRPEETLADWMRSLAERRRPVLSLVGLGAVFAAWVGLGRPQYARMVGSFTRLGANRARLAERQRRDDLRERFLRGFREEEDTIPGGDSETAADPPSRSDGRALPDDPFADEPAPRDRSGGMVDSSGVSPEGGPGPREQKGST
jgi:hypothetical protein